MIRPAGILAILISFLVLPVTSLAQISGFIDDTDVALWLVADSNAVNTIGNPAANGEEIDNWTEVGMNGFQAVRVTNGPIYRPDGGADFNNHAVIEFDNTQRYLSVADDDELDGGHSGLSAFVVFKRGATQTRCLFMKRTAVGSEISYGVFYNDAAYNLYGYLDGATVGGISAIGAAGSHIGSYVFDGSLIASNRLQLTLDGGTTDLQNTANTTITNYANDLLIGLFNPGDTRYLNGDQIAELLIVKKALSNAQREITENYFSAKYGSTISNDYYAGNDASYIIGFSGIGNEADASYSSSNSEGLVVDAISGFDVGEYVIFAHDGTVNSVVTADVTGGVEARWGRDWYVEKTGILNSRIAFDLSEGINGLYPQNVSNYRLLYRNTTSGNYSEATVSGQGVANGDQIYFDVNDVNLLDGYFTLGSVDTAASSLVGHEGRSWYTLISGDWTDSIVWTLDPSGTQWVNPDGYTPTSSPTALSDKVFILSGRTVTIQAGDDNKQNAQLNVNGRLDLTTSTGHDFGGILGEGRILMAADNFPAGDPTHFVTPGQGEGTVVYYGGSYNLATARTFYNVEISLDNPANTLTLLADYTINGNLTIEDGELQINDNTSTTGLNIIVGETWTVESNGEVLTGTGNAAHTATIDGDFINYGTARFTNRVAPDYNNPANNGLVHLVFNNASANQAIKCYGVTNFYRIVIDKGIDDTYILSIEASNASYFNLFGPANYGHGSVAQLATNDNALGLLRGTVKIGTNVNIPVLNNTGNYNISESARIWVNGGFVAKNQGTAIVPYGVAQVSTGTFEARVGSGFTLRDNGKILVEGGVLNTYQIRTSVLGPTNVGGYVQSGGTVNLLDGNSDADYYKFCLTYPGNVFHMTGGTLHLYESYGKGGIFINSDPEKINVSGGTVICDLISAENFIITSRAPFYNLTLNQPAGAGVGYEYHLAEGVDVGSSDEDLAAQPLVVLNDFILNTDPATTSTDQDVLVFMHNGEDVTIGRNFTIERGARYEWGENATENWIGGWSANTTIFNGTEDGELYFTWHNNPSNGEEQNFWNFVVDKPSGKRLKIIGDSATKDMTDVNNRLIKTHGELRIESGTLDQDVYSIRIYGDIVNKDVLGTYVHGVTPDNANLRLRTVDFIIQTIDGAEFGLVKLISADAVISFTSDVYIHRINFHSGRLNLGEYNLKLDYLYNGRTDPTFAINNGNETNKMFITNGLSSDGGLSLLVPEGSPANFQITFPLGLGIGAGAKYTPARFRFDATASNPADAGYVTIRPVDSELQTTNLGGGEILDYYWRVTYEGFATLPTVNRMEYRFDKSDAGTDSLLYVPGKVLDESPYTRSTDGGVNNVDESIHEITFPTDITLEKANYTCGVPGRFTGSVSIFYTRDHGVTYGVTAREPRWTDRLTWTRDDLLNPLYSPHDSRQPAPVAGANSIPQAGDVAVIGWIPWDDVNKDGVPNNGTGDAGDVTDMRGQPHGVWIDDNTQTCAELNFTLMTDAGGNPVARVYRSNFQFRPTLCINWTNGNLVTGLVRGEGMFWNRRSDPDFTLMDIGEFASEDSSYVVYEVWDNNDVLVNTPPVFPNLMVATDGWGNNDRNFTFEEDIVTNGNFEILGDANVVLDNDATGDITIGRDLIMFEFQGSEGGASGGGGELLFQNNGTGRILTINGNIDNQSSGTNSGGGNGGIIQVDNPNAAATDHHIYLYGNYSQDCAAAGIDGMILYTADDEDRVTLHLEGTRNMSFSNVSGDVPVLYRLLVNKGTDQTTTATIPCEVTLGGLTNVADKALELSNGTLILNHPDIDFTLSSGYSNFLIPGTSSLVLQQGNAEVTGTDIGILLDGRLQIDGGTIDLGTTIGNGNNFIEYSSTGTAELIVNGGQLTVGSQIRRGLTSDVGILSYTQTGGTVIVGKDFVPESNRGVFEIIGAGSSFSHSGGSLSLIRQQTNPTKASLYLDPETYSLSAGTTIDLGGALTPAGQEFGIYSSIPLRNLRLNNTGGNDPDAQMWVVPLILEEDLTIDNASSFDANGLDLNIRGDLLNNGTFIPSGNTTTFDGSGAQLITGNTDFYNLVKSNSNRLDLNTGNSDLQIQNILNLQGGIFDDNDNNVVVAGDCNNDATHLYGGTGRGIELNGTLQQVLTGNGTFGKLAINNINGVRMPIGNNISISDVLRLESGVFDIGSNLMDLEVNAVIESGSPFSATNMIQTNLSFTDNGVRKTYPAGASNFIYPMGSAGKYTPVNFTISANGNSTGSITVKPANERHPSIIEDVEAPPIVDADNVLQYHWVLRANGISAFSAQTTMKYIPTDVEVTAPYTVYDYITARLLSDGSGNWNKYPDVDKFDEVNELLIFDFVGVNTDGISGDYTAGITDAIPDVVPLYQTETDGLWTNGTIWDPDVTGGPRGAIARINAPDTVNVTVNFLSSYETQIIGRVNVNSTFAHRFGIVNGTGTLYTERESLPAGSYDNFFSSAGGTVEFGGTSDYDLLGGYTYVNNLTLSGQGERRLPNSDLLLYGDFLMNTTGSLEFINEYDRNFTVLGDFGRTGGSFDAGNSTSTVQLSGTSNQLISGGFTGGNAFNRLNINNAAGVTLSGSIQIEDQLQLSSGILTSGNDTVKIEYAANISPAAGSSGSYVDGNLCKELFTGDSFEYPIGDGAERGNMSLLNVDNFTGIQCFNSRYHYTTPPNATVFSSPVTEVSLTEYWEISAPNGADGQIRINLDGSSDIANGSDPDSLRLVTWNGSAWVIVGGALNHTGTAASGTITTSSNITFDGITQLFAIASIQTIIYATVSFSTANHEICIGSSTTLSAVFNGENPWDFSYTDGTTTFNETGLAVPIFDIVVSPVITTTYTLLSVSDNNGAGSVVGNFDIEVTVNSLPTPTLTGNLTGCQGSTGAVYTTEAGMTNYNWIIPGGALVTAGGTISDNTVTITWTGSGTQTIGVNYTNASGCSAATATELDVEVYPEPVPTVAGIDTVCTGATGLVYTTEAGMTTYVWTISAGGTITAGGGAGNSTVTIDWGTPGTENVSVYYIDANNCTALPADIDVEVMPTPTTGPFYHINNSVFQ